MLIIVLTFPHLRQTDRKTLRYSLLGGAALFFVYAGATFGVSYTSISNTGFIVSLTVVFVPIFEWILFKIKPSKMLVFITFGCVVGLALLTLNDNYQPRLGDFFCLISASASALNLIVTERAISKENIDPIRMTTIELLFVGVTMLITAYLFEKPQLPQSGSVWAGILFLSLVCTGAATLIQTTQQKLTRATNVGLIYSLEPVFSAIVAYIFAKERLGTRGATGAVIMLACLVYMELRVKADEH